MSQDRVKAVVDDIVDSVRDVLRKHEVTFDEYRAGFFHIIETAKSGEMPLLMDMLLNATVCEIEMQNRRGSQNNVQGPYFIEGAPVVSEAIKTRGDVEPLRLQGQVTDLDGEPLQDAVIDIWFADGDGKYSGYSDDFPIEYFRGKVETDADGRYDVMASFPREYPITKERHGPTGSLVDMLGRQGWRPAHIHYMLRKDGSAPLVTQAYFEGGDYLDADPVEAVIEDLIYPTPTVDGVKTLTVDFRLDPAATA